MNRFTSLFITIALLFLAAWLGIIAYSYLQLGHLKPYHDDDNVSFPPNFSGKAILGAQVYAANGCVYCHSQQVQQPNISKADIGRNWGKRPSVARDYLEERTAFLGMSRLGPDLSNYGMRVKDPNDPQELNEIYVHLYAAQATFPNSIMPSYSYLFNLEKIEGAKSEEALDLPPTYTPRPGYQVVPTAAARNLVAYLLSLKQDYKLPEAPEVQMEEN